METSGADMSPATGAEDGNPCKRQKMVMGNKGNYVLFSCYDEPEKYVEANMEMLESFQCRLASVVNHTDPCTLPNGKQFWRAGMTRAMLISMIRSLTLGELVVSKGVAISEALATLEYEGVNIGSTAPQPSVDHPRVGVGFAKEAAGSSRDALVSLCEQIADAILQWPRLETAMECALGSVQQVRFAAVQSKMPTRNGMNLSVTSDRAWIRFADRPKTDGGDTAGMSFVNKLVCSNPRWFSESVIALGVVHYRLCCKLGDPEFTRSRDEKSFKRLVQEIEADPFDSFFCVRMDICKAVCESRTRKELNKGERFYNDVRQAIIEFSRETATDSDARPTLMVQYSRAIVTFVENMMTSMPVCARIFSAACSDESGTTPERTALKKALKTRGVSVIRWIEERDAHVRPLVFPPNWREMAASSCYGPSVLLSFESLR
jgi:hypothetical protein|tara:strand:+ start:5158 stop:6456 length:1299 start_codon:yes stop_codon:yes gene_type:complete